MMYTIGLEKGFKGIGNIFPAIIYLEGFNFVTYDILKQGFVEFEGM